MKNSTKEEDIELAVALTSNKDGKTPETHDGFQVRAPCNLPPGFRFAVEHFGQQFVVTVVSF